MPARSPRPMTEAEYIRRVLIAVGIVALFAALYLLSDILLLAFGAVLVAVVLHEIARPMRRNSLMSERLALGAAVLAVIAVLVSVGYFYGKQISSQLLGVFDNLPAAAVNLSKSAPFLSVTELVKGTSIGNLVVSAFSWGTTVFGAAAMLVIVIVAGIYVAVTPEVYRTGFLMLFPPRIHSQIRETLHDSGQALRLWIGAQVVAMILVGILTGIGLAVIGVPSALALGFIAGVAEFVPIIGPIIGAIPALLLASTVSWETVLWTLLLFILVQQVESNIITPLIARRAVNLPPALGLFAVVALGVLFGPLGLILGYPLAIVCDVVVRRLYVREALGEDVEIVGEDNRDQSQAAAAHRPAPP